MKNMHDLPTLESELKTLLCEDDTERELDSIETVMVASFLAGKNIEIEEPASFGNTIKGWLEWLSKR